MDGRGDVEGGGRRKIPRSLLAVCAVTTHAVPRHHRGLGCCQKYPFLFLEQSLASSAPLPPAPNVGVAAGVRCAVERSRGVTPPLPQFSFN